MPSADQISEQTAKELDRRRRLAVPAFAGGLLYLLSSIVISSTLNGAPTVGLLQGLAPAISGVANPQVSPRAEEVKFISRHALPLIAGSLLAAIAIGALLLILLLLIDATNFRRPLWKAARPLVLYGGIAVIVVSVGHQVVSAIETHNFAVSSDHSNHAVDQALTKGAANMIVQYVDLLAGLALAAGMIATMMAAQRVGLLPRWMGILGIFTGLLDLPADRRRPAAGDPRLLDGHDRDHVRRALAERRPACVGRRRSPAVAQRGGAARRTPGRRQGRSRPSSALPLERCPSPRAPPPPAPRASAGERAAAGVADRPRRSESGLVARRSRAGSTQRAVSV